MKTYHPLRIFTHAMSTAKNKISTFFQNVFFSDFCISGWLRNIPNIYLIDCRDIFWNIGKIPGDTKVCSKFQLEGWDVRRGNERCTINQKLLLLFPQKYFFGIFSNNAPSSVKLTQDSEFICRQTLTRKCRWCIHYLKQIAQKRIRNGIVSLRWLETLSKEGCICISFNILIFSIYYENDSLKKLYRTVSIACFLVGLASFKSCGRTRRS